MMFSLAPAFSNSTAQRKGNYYQLFKAVLVQPTGGVEDS
ncbi:hypothetical protein C7428_2350 [Pantoea ananatis]|jgi:hypothetical protein|nr:hypothetical protein C7428_2350 [Pantoea ananatis]